MGDLNLSHDGKDSEQPEKGEGTGSSSAYITILFFDQPHCQAKIVQGH